MEEKKFCKFCGEQIDKSSIACPKCGRQVEIIKEERSNNIQTPNIIAKEKTPKFYEQEWFMWLMLVIFAPIGIFLMFNFNKRMNQKVKTVIAVFFAILFILFFFTGNNTDSENNSSTNNNQNETTNNETNTNTENNNSINTNKKDYYTFNEAFEFDDLEITIGSDYSFTTINNKYSDYYQKDVVKLPITVKNLSNETHSLNMFYYDVYGSQGTETKTVGTYFDDDIDFAGDLRSGASYTKYMYFLYDGNGTYAIEFDDWWNKVTVEFTITK